MKPILSNFHIKLGNLGIVLALLLIAPAAWGATYYAVYADLGDGVQLYYRAETWPTASEKNQTVTNDIEEYLVSVLSAGDYLVLSGGASETVYANTVLDGDSQLAWTTGKNLRSAISTDPDYAQHSGQVILRSATQTTIHSNGADDFTIGLKGYPESGITVEATLNTKYGINLVSTSSGINIYYLKIQNTPLVGVFNQGNTNFVGLDISGQTVSGGGAFYDVSGSGTCSFFKFHGNLFGVRLDSASTTPSTKFYNGLFIGNTNSAVYCSTANAVNTSISNSILTANVSSLTTSHIVAGNAAGTITLKNNIITYHPTDPANYGLSNVTDGGGNLYRSPSFITHKNPGILVVGIDDSINFGRASAVKNLGMPVSFGINTASFSDWSGLNTALSGGNFEAVAHGHSHTNLSYTHGLDFAQIGGANCTVAYNGLTIVMDCDGADYDQTVNVTSSSYDTFSEIIAAYNGVKGWAISKSTAGGQNASSIGDGCQISGLSIFTAQSVPYTADFNRTGYTEGFFYNEIVQPKTLINSHISPYLCTTFYPPYNDTDAAIRSEIEDAGYSGNRGEANSAMLLSTADKFNIRYLDVNTWMGGAEPTEAVIRLRAGSLFEYMNYVGGIIVLYAHGESDFSLASWAILSDAVSQSGVRTMLFSAAVAALVAYTTPADNSDYYLRSNSPAIGSGVPILTYAQWIAAGGDFAGKNPTAGTFSIGAYQYQAQKTSDFPALPIWSGGGLDASKPTDAGSYVQP